MHCPSEKSPKTCQVCGQLFIKGIGCSNRVWETRKYCSKVCSGAAKIGVESKKKGRVLSQDVCDNMSKAQLEFYKTHSVWNKGIHYEQVANDKNYAWKGIDASLEAKHEWVRRRLGRPQKCEHCGTTEKRMYHWANVSGEYKRDFSDYIRLCVPCHKRYDLDKVALHKKQTNI